MDMEALKSPYVWGGGVLLGLVLLVTKSEAGNAATTGAVASVSPAVLSASTQMNAAALGAQIQLASISAHLGETKISADVAEQAQFYGYLKSQDDNNTVLAGKQMETQAGITNNIITSGTALQIDQANNANRLSLAYVDADKSRYTADSQVKIASLQADAAKAVSKNSLFGSIAGAIGGVAKTALLA